MCRYICKQHRLGGKSWQPFGEGKIAHKNFRLARICYFCDKGVVFVRNCNFTNLSQFNMLYMPCNNLAQETLLLSQKSTLVPQV